MRSLAGVALAVLLTAASCDGASEEQRARPGDALQDLRRFAYTVTPKAAFAPGQELVVMIAHLRNVSRAPIVIRRIDPVGLVGSPRVARVVAIELTERGPGVRAGVPLGVYQTYPPVSTRGTGSPCSVDRLVRARGHVLKPSRHPDDVALLAIRIRIRAPGDFRLRAERVVYEQGKERYYEDVPFSVRIAGRGSPCERTSARART